MDVNEILEENVRRNRALTDIYDPATGRGCTGERVRLLTPDGVIFAPAAMMTLLSYPGMLPGTGDAKLSTGAAPWMPAQKAHIAASLPSSTAWMMSLRGSDAPGMQRKPRPS